MTETHTKESNMHINSCSHEWRVRKLRAIPVKLGGGGQGEELINTEGEHIVHIGLIYVTHTHTHMHAPESFISTHTYLRKLHSLFRDLYS